VDAHLDRASLRGQLTADRLEIPDQFFLLGVLCPPRGHADLVLNFPQNVVLVGREVCMIARF